MEATQTFIRVADEDFELTVYQANGSTHLKLISGDVKLSSQSLLSLNYRSDSKYASSSISSAAKKIACTSHPLGSEQRTLLQASLHSTDYEILTYHTMHYTDLPASQVTAMDFEVVVLKPTATPASLPMTMLLRGAASFAEDTEDLRIDSVELIQCKIDLPRPTAIPESSWNLNLVILTACVALIYTYGPLGVVLALCTLLCRPFLRTKPNSNGNVFFVNGWQAWSYCGAVPQGRTVPPYAMPQAFVRGFHAGSPALDINLKAASSFRLFSRQEHIASDLFTCIANTLTSKAICTGFLSQKESFGYFTSDADYRSIGIHCACDGVRVHPNKSRITTDWALIQIHTTLPEEIFASYFTLSGTYNQVPTALRAATTPVGWCSWYHFFEKVSESDLYNNIKTLSDIQHKHRFADKLLFQIDDGYQDSWGDWLSLSKKQFPSQSMPALVKAIQAADMTPGVWAAPFACDKHSVLARDHPSWLLRKQASTTPCNSGNCGKWFYGLDVTHPDVQNFIRNTLSVAVKEWGFQYLKLDFLYAAALEHCQLSYHNPFVTRAQAMQIGLDTIQSAQGIQDVFILGCGAPLGSVIGRVQANRISADAGLSWNPEFPLPAYDAWNLPCARNMVRNSLCRLGMHGRWWINDPDCLLLRQSTRFTDDEILGIATVKAFSGGSIIISDDLKTVSAERLRVAQSILPTIGVAAVALDLLEQEMPEVLRLPLCSLGADYTLLALCNWSSTPKNHTLALQTLFPSHSLTGESLIVVFDFWTQRCHLLSAADCRLGAVTLPDKVAVHSASVLACRLLVNKQQPLYLGSNLHFSCGRELVAMNFEESKGGGKVKLAVARAFLKDNWTGRVWLYIPHEAASLRLKVCSAHFAEVSAAEVSPLDDWGSIVQLTLPTAQRGEASATEHGDTVVLEVSW